MRIQDQKNKSALEKYVKGLILLLLNEEKVTSNEEGDKPDRQREKQRETNGES